MEVLFLSVTMRNKKIYGIVLLHFTSGQTIAMLIVMAFLLFYLTHLFIYWYSYSLVLRHTTEEVLDACIEALEPARAALTSQLRKQVMDDLADGLKQHSWFKGFDISNEPPVSYSLEQWIKLAKEVQATVFIAG